MIARAKTKELLRRLQRQLWIRPAIYCCSAIATAWLATLTDDMFPNFDFIRVAKQTIRDLLGIIASSMLAVTIFAVSVMNAAYSSAVRATTPRAFEIMIADNSTKQALSSFLGAFIFAVIGVIGVNQDLFGPTGRAFMLVMTLAIFVWVVATFVYWIDHVTQLGQMRHTLESVARSAEKALIEYLSRPVRRATPVAPGAGAENAGYPVTAGEGGVVKSLSVSQLIALADENDVEFDIVRIPGSPVGTDDALCHVSGAAPNEALKRSVRECFVIGYGRDFEQDPELAVRMLSEIADRALSPGINDPGTAIDVLDALNRVFCQAFKATAKSENTKSDERVRMPLIAPETLVNAAFEQIGRDGSGQIEVAKRLQHSLRTVANSAPPEFNEAIRTYAARALKRSEDALNDEWEKARVRAAANWVL